MGSCSPSRPSWGSPVKLVGLGESLDDLVPFDPDEFVDALFDGVADPLIGVRSLLRLEPDCVRSPATGEAERPRRASATP